MSTLPHEREKIFLDDIIDDCLKGRNKLVLVITPVYSNTKWLANEAWKIAQDLKPDDAKQIMIHREALEFTNGAIVRFDTYSDPSRLRGIHPDRVVLMGEWGEFWYLITTMIKGDHTTVEAVA